MAENILGLKAISEKLRTRRLYRVSEETGISYGTLKKLEKGDGNPTYDILVTISKYLTNE